jgi:hypothetical protein
MIAIDLSPTLRLHERLAGLAQERPDDVARGLSGANAAIRSRGVTFGGEKEMPIALSALVLSAKDVARLEAAARMLWSILEKVLDATMDDPGCFDRWAADHRRMRPWLRKTPGSKSWQLFSRYDAAVAPDGRVQFIECNTGCPAGFLHAADFSVETRSVLESMGALPDRPIKALGMIRPTSLVDLLTSVEERSGLPTGLFGLLTDENNLKLELDLLERGLRDRGRRAAVVDSRTLDYFQGRLRCGGEAISVAFQKVRVSTPESPHHCWKPGFEHRYGSLLAAIGDEAVAPVNNLCALSVAEDKTMLARLFHPETRGLLSPEERAFVDENIPWTARLAPGSADYRGEAVDLLEFVRKRKDAFVVKPANEGRGYEVHVGPQTPQEEWDRLCRPNPRLPMVVQEFVPPVALPVARLAEGGVRSEPMHLTIALGMVDGRYEGVLSRISPNIVTNVGRQGFVQAVFVA